MAGLYLAVRHVLVFKLFWVAGASRPGCLHLRDGRRHYGSDVPHGSPSAKRVHTLSTADLLRAMFSMGHLFTPRPWLCTILFFVIELDILMHARRTGKLRALAWLPLIFALWANVHIQFVYGLLFLGLALVEAILACWWTAVGHSGSHPCGWERPSPPQHSGDAGESVWLAYLRSCSRSRDAVGRTEQDLRTTGNSLPRSWGLSWSCSWRSGAPRHWLRSEGSCSLKAPSCCRPRFCHSGRSATSWVVAIVAAAVLALSIPGPREVPHRLPAFASRLATFAALLVVAASFRILHIDNSVLQSHFVDDMPVRAVEVIRERGYPGPLFNNFSWGGYLIWNLPQPVSIDGRQNLYGDEGIDRSLSTWGAEPGWASDPS